MDDTANLATVGELLAEPPEDVPFAVDETLPSGGVSLLVGAPKTGKTVLELSLAMGMAQQGQFLGRGCIGGGVVLLAFEEKRHQLRESLRQLGAQPDDPILVYTGHPTVPEGEQPWEWLERAAFGPASNRISSAPVLVIVDTLARLIRIRDGNDYHEVTDALAGIITLARETGIHIMLVHHSRKGGNGTNGMEFGEEVLGSQALVGSVDAAISLRRDSSTGARMVYSVQRYGTDIPLSYLVRDPETGAVSLGVTKSEASAQRYETDVLDFVAASRRAVAMVEIERADSISGRAKDIREAVKRLARAGKLNLTDGVRKGVFNYYVPHCTGAD